MRVSEKESKWVRVRVKEIVSKSYNVGILLWVNFSDHFRESKWMSVSEWETEWECEW